MAKKLAPLHPAHLLALHGLDLDNWHTQAEATERAAGPRAVSVRTLRTLCKKRLAKSAIRTREIKPGRWEPVEVFRLSPKGAAVLDAEAHTAAAKATAPACECEGCGLGDGCNVERERGPRVVPSMAELYRLGRIASL